MRAETAYWVLCSNDPINCDDPSGLSYALLGGVAAVAGGLLGSIGVDASTGGLNILATPAELAAAFAAGYGVGAAFDRANSPPDLPDPQSYSPKVPTPAGPPPFPVPGYPGATWGQVGPQRDGVPSWIPVPPVKSQTGAQPSASWDGDGSGHWDCDDGKGGRQRYDHRGKPINPDQAHDPEAPVPPKNR